MHTSVRRGETAGDDRGIVHLTCATMGGRTTEDPASSTRSVPGGALESGPIRGENVGFSPRVTPEGDLVADVLPVVLLAGPSGPGRRSGSAEVARPADGLRKRRTGEPQPGGFPPRGEDETTRSLTSTGRRRVMTDRQAGQAAARTGGGKERRDHRAAPRVSLSCFLFRGSGLPVALPHGVV